LVNLNETLGELGISENGVELTEIEKSATIRDLLMSSSGIYLDADAQQTTDKKRPKRGQHKPGEYYYYNNFDFNALATILKLKTSMSYDECLLKWLAIPLEMQEFQRTNVIYGTPFSKIDTQHPAYKTWMSARDLAKIGSMVSQKGIWKDKRIVSEAWIKESTAPYRFFSDEDKKWPKTAYSYLWSIDTETGNIWGSGYGGQHVMIDTTNQLTLVQRHYTGNSILSQGLYNLKNTQSSQVDLMQVWYALLRTKSNKN
jgi:CubicO group peptidase (beta-lactamase class C family)